MSTALDMTDAIAATESLLLQPHDQRTEERLARSCQAWAQLAEFCQTFGLDDIGTVAEDLADRCLRARHAIPTKETR